ncbi:hypothetical protein SGLAM104S_09920 [Streptomyces glaucescens]
MARENSSGGGTAVAVDSLADRVVTALDADGAAVHRPELGSLVATVPGDPQARNEARQAVAAVDDEAVRLKSAVKARDGFFTTFFISPYSRYIARWCARRGLTPNQVTTASLITALIAAGCAATGTRGGFVAAGILLIASFVLDCTDGQLARYSLQYSTLGAWLDATFDRAKEYAYYAGLALGAARGGDDVWALALGAMVLQTCRHVVDFSFNEANHDATANTSPTAALSDKLDSVGWTVWVRRMIVLPIGERWAMIAVLTALTTPRITFYALLIGCAFAAAYTTAGRVLRSLTRKANRTDRAATALADLADSGPLAEGFAAAFRNPARPCPASPVPALAAARRRRRRRHLRVHRARQTLGRLVRRRLRPASGARPRGAAPPGRHRGQRLPPSARRGAGAQRYRHVGVGATPARPPGPATRSTTPSTCSSRSGRRPTASSADWARPSRCTCAGPTSSRRTWPRSCAWHGLPVLPEEIGFTPEEFVRVVEFALETRPGRYTILEHLDLKTHQIKDIYADYVKAIGS